MNIFGYKKCSTCTKAIKYYEQNGNDVEFFDFIKEQIPQEVLERLIDKSNQPINDFFNSKGVLFKELELKDKIPELNDEEKVELLLSNGKLIKRPIIEDRDKIIIGFRP
ncbi:Spx/MgsR family RNA polymerase-binding regulatory protein [Mycoplasma sp. P36-A1]|uniref:Spx/MgsR family RNA polymerase-binding regulatory protein n=1 Tax=Mycoplasma sp. P36-A1 TaxID=3252900 RepID=UPI003C2BC922